MNILVDMNLSPRWVGLLRQAGFRAEHWTSLGKPDASDIEIFNFAKFHKYVILTQDLDFGDLLIIGRVIRPSIVIIRSAGLRPEAIVEQVVNSLTQAEAELQRGAMVVIDPARSRFRSLPL